MFASIVLSIPSDLAEFQPLIQIAFEALSGSNEFEIDSALEILSVVPDLKIEIGETDFAISVSKIGEIHILKEKVVGRCSFYLLPLSVELLKPKQEDHGVLLKTKFATLAKIANSGDLKKREEIRAIFYESLGKMWSDEVSAALRGLAMCVNVIDMNVGFLRELFASPQTSWLHSSALLAVLKEIEIGLISETFCLEIIEILIGFAMHEHVGLSDEARGVFLKFAKAYNVESVSDKVIKRIRVCESFELLKLASLLISLVREFPKETASLEWAYDLFAELVLWNETDLAVLTELFTFLGLFPKPTKTIEAVTIAHRVIVCFHCAISGETINTGKSPELQRMQKVVEDYIDSVHLDIVARPSLTLADFLAPYTAALRFFFSQAQNAHSTWDVCKRMFPFAPLECSIFYFRESMAVLSIEKANHGFGDDDTDAHRGREFSIWSNVRDVKGEANFSQRQSKRCRAVQA
jgi:hypothetical protein